MQRFWISRYPEDTPPIPDDLKVWSDQLEISEFLAELLWKRGYRTLEDMSLFLNPSLKHLAPLEEWSGLQDTAKIIAEAVVAGKKLAVWGDYDVDGITAAALVVDFFRKHEIDIRAHIPSRMETGYGLNVPELEMLAAEGINLILTVDCGISDLEEVKAANALGLQIIISDHHLPGDTLPEAAAICAPTVNKCATPYLAGVGVAFMLMAAVNNALLPHGFKKIDIRPLLDLVALGTMADVSKLCPQNRILVKNGLLALSEGSRPGIAALKSVCNYAPNTQLGAGQVVFTLAPRINASGRMGKSEIALELLLTNDQEQATRLAAELDALNMERRSEEEQILKEARELATEYVQAGRMGLVLYRPHWHMGIIGIVASRIVEEFLRPTIVLCNQGEIIKGSGRSVEGFDLHSSLGECADLFIGFGGHKMAAGMSLKEAQLGDFTERFDNLVKKEFGSTPPPHKIKTDGNLTATETVNFTLLKELELLQPFGHGNAEPVFISAPLLIRDIRSRPGLSIVDVLDEESGLTLRAKLWRPNDVIPPQSKGRKMRLAYSPRIDRYNGAANVELRVRDWFIENDF